MLKITKIFIESDFGDHIIFEGVYRNDENRKTVQVIDPKIWANDEKDQEVLIKLATAEETENDFVTKDILQKERELFTKIKKHPKFEHLEISLPEFIFSGKIKDIQEAGSIYEDIQFKPSAVFLYKKIEIIPFKVLPLS